MAQIEIHRQPGGGVQMNINGVDFTMEIYDGFQLVEVGDVPDLAEIGLQVTFVVSTLSLDNETVPLTDRFMAAASLVRSCTDTEAPDFAAETKVCRSCANPEKSA